MHDRYVNVLPEHYREVLHINAKEKRFGLLMNIAALLVLVVVLAVAVPLIGRQNILADAETSLARTSLILLGFVVSMLLYIVLHELVHGLVYHLLTHRKLTFGLSWSCAFCGVPDIYVCHRTALLALLAPFVTFTLLLVPLTVWLGICAPLAGLFSAILLGLHLGGCSGDLYVTGLFLFRYRSEDLLMRDTGPEQYFYLPSDAKGEDSRPEADSTSDRSDAASSSAGTVDGDPGEKKEP